MYERFTDRARKVMQLANHEAQRFNHEYIGTEHILLGLMKEDGSIAANVLKNMDVSLQTIRNEVEAIVASGPEMVTMGRLPQTPRTKKVVELAVQSAQVLNHGYVGTEHLLLGLIKEGEGIACQVLKNLGVIAEDVTEEILHLLGHKTTDDGKLAKQSSTWVDADGKPLTPEQAASAATPHIYTVFLANIVGEPSDEAKELTKRMAEEYTIRAIERSRCLAILDELAKATESAAAKAAYLLAVKRIREDGTEKKENGK